jgi:SNF2 family DNA or RNA helicase
MTQLEIGLTREDAADTLQCELRSYQKQALHWMTQLEIGLTREDAADTLQCELRSYQKQALHWMTQLEIGLAREDAADTLHPCWEAYHLAEGYSSLLFCHMEVELGKALSSYVQDVFCSCIYSSSIYNGLHSCTFDCKSELAFYLNMFSGEATLDFPSALQTA